MFSLEVPESLEQLMLGDPLHTSSFPKCLRNVAIPPMCKGKEVFPMLLDDDDLRSAFPTSINSSGIVQALERRFDGLPIHEKCYYQSYYPTEDVLADLERAMDTRAGGKSQDCLGMTPLHILACSTKHDVRLYQLLIEKYPETLITKDKWGDIPLLYAFWSRAPRETLQLLIESHTTLFSDHVVDLVSMVQTLSRADAPLVCIQTLLETMLSISPYHDINWQDVLVEWAEDAKRPNDRSNSNRQVPFATFQYLLEFVISNISERIESMDVKRWREELESDLGGISFPRVKVSSSKLDLINRAQGIKSLYSKLVSYEQLKESTSLLELALWKAKIDGSMPNARRREGEESSQKKARIDTSAQRYQCRVNSGAEIVLPNVRPYLFLLPSEDNSNLAADGEDESVSSIDSLM
jgi:hypothetical protein